MAAHSDTTQLPEVALTIEFINRRCEDLGLTLEQANRITAVVRAIRETLRHGIVEICSRLAVPKTAQNLPMIQPCHLQQVIEDPDLIAALIGRGSLTSEALADCRQFLELLTVPVPDVTVRLVPLDYVTVSDLCKVSGSDPSVVQIVTNMATALEEVLANPKADAFTGMRATFAEPPVTSLMMHTALEDWDMWHQLLDEKPERVSFATIKLTRAFLSKLI